MAGGREHSFQRQRISAKILDDLNSFLRFSLNDPRLQFVSITRVDLNSDYSQVLAYWDTWSEDIAPGEAAMNSAKGKLRSLLARALGQSFKLKSVPQLLLVRDTQYSDEKRIGQLLDADTEIEDATLPNQR